MKKVLLPLLLLLISSAIWAQTPCTPSTGITCTTNLSLYVPDFNYANWNVPLNQNWSLIDADSANWAKLNTANTFTGNITAPTFIGNLTGNVTGNATGLSGTPSISITNLAAAGTVTLPSLAGVGTYCLQISSLGVVSNTGVACGGAAQVYPGAGIAVSTGSAWGVSLAAPASTIVGISDSQTLSNKAFGTGMTWPTFNQNTTGTAAGLSVTLVAASGGTGEAGTLTGVLYGNGTSPFTVATGAQLVAGIGSTAVTNATNAVNLTGTTPFSLPYQSAAGVTSYLNGNTATQPSFYTSTGTGAAAQAPTLTSSVGTGSVVLAGSPTGTGNVKWPHFIATGTPGVACGTGAGTAPSLCAIEGNDEAGQVSVTTGSAPASASVIATITLANACPTKVYAVIRGSNQNAAQLSGNTHDYPDSFTSTSWTITSNATGLTASTAYTWAYIARCN